MSVLLGDIGGTYARFALAGKAAVGLVNHLVAPSDPAVVFDLMAVDRFPVEASHILMFARAIGDPYGFWIVAALAIASGADYVMTWSRRALSEHRALR